MYRMVMKIRSASILQTHKLTIESFCGVHNVSKIGDLHSMRGKAGHPGVRFRKEQASPVTVDHEPIHLSLDVGSSEVEKGYISGQKIIANEAIANRHWYV